VIQTRPTGGNFGLAHTECPVSGEIFTVGAGHVARFFIGRTKGYFNPRLSMEDVRTHLDEIRDETDYTVPAGPAEEMVELFKPSWPSSSQA
jgi:hypothetical protein